MRDTRLTQRDFMRKLLDEYGHDQRRVCAAYAQADRKGRVRRKTNVNRITSEFYARCVWADGHRPRDPWILRHCQARGIETVLDGDSEHEAVLGAS